MGNQLSLSYRIVLRMPELLNAWRNSGSSCPYPLRDESSWGCRVCSVGVLIYGGADTSDLEHLPEVILDGSQLHVSHIVTDV